MKATRVALALLLLSGVAVAQRRRGWTRGEVVELVEVRPERPQNVERIIVTVRRSDGGAQHGADDEGGRFDPRPRAPDELRSSAQLLRASVDRCRTDARSPVAGRIWFDGEGNVRSVRVMPPHDAQLVAACITRYWRMLHNFGPRSFGGWTWDELLAPVAVVDASASDASADAERRD